MTPNPILKVLSTLKRFQVKYLLIGGQACIIYGAAEFSRDSDVIILNTVKNISCLKRALKVLRAKTLYVPPLAAGYLKRGHACHFRCTAKDVRDVRIDVISKLRGCDSFGRLWQRRKRIALKKGFTIDVIGLKDLVRSKKTQRDKDWLMLKRLVTNDIYLRRYKAKSEHVEWWFKECRNPIVLIKLAKKYLWIAKNCIQDRPLILLAIKGDMQRLTSQIQKEEAIERQRDIEYWRPLKKELEILRRKEVALQKGDQA